MRTKRKVVLASLVSLVMVAAFMVPLLPWQSLDPVSAGEYTDMAAIVKALFKKAQEDMPVVTVTSPANGSTVLVSADTALTDISLLLTATTNELYDVSLVKYQLDGGLELGSATQAPYSVALGTNLGSLDGENRSSFISETGISHVITAIATVGDYVYPSDQSAFTLVEVPLDDENEDGIPDNPFDLLNEGDVLTSTLDDPVNGTTIVVVASLDDTPGGMVLSIVYPDTGEIATITVPGVTGLLAELGLDPGSEVIVLFQMADTLEGLLASGADTIPPTPSMIVGGKYIEISLIVQTAEGFDEIEDLGTLFITLTLQGVDVVDGDSVNLLEYPTTVETGLVLMPGAGDWTKVSDDDVSAGDSIITAELSQFSIFQPVNDPLRIDSVDPIEGPKAGGTLLQLSGSFFVYDDSDETATVFELTSTAAALYEVTIGGNTAPFRLSIDDEALNATDAYVTAPAGTPGPVDVVITEKVIPGVVDPATGTLAEGYYYLQVMPNVFDKPEAEARTLITDAGLLEENITVSTTSSETIAAGNVISQTPVADSDVRLDADVDLVVSSGPTVCGGTITLTGIDPATGTDQGGTLVTIMGSFDALGAADEVYTVTFGGVDATVSMVSKIGAIYATTPGGTVTGMPVDVTVTCIDDNTNSDTLPGAFTYTSQVEVPDVVGDTQAVAEAAITAAGLVAAVTGACSDTVDAGLVISQDPAGGTMVVPGSTVNIVVSLGPCDTEVPNVVGLTQAAAEIAIEDAGLVVGTVVEEHSDTVAIGIVISQDPAAATMVASGSEVDLVVSLGPVPVSCEGTIELTGLDPATGPSTGGTDVMILGSFSELSNANAVYTATFGGVIATVKAASTAGAIYVTTRDSGLTAETVVDVVVTCKDDNTNSDTLTGAFTYYVTIPQVAVPEVVGLTQTAATTAIEAVGLVAAVTGECSDTVAAGLVISQAPAGGTMVALGSTVDIVVSLGPCDTEVPNVVGLTQAAAETAIEDAGLVVGTVVEEHSDTVAIGIVISQDPAAATMVASGSEVDLVVSLGPVPVPCEGTIVLTGLDPATGPSTGGTDVMILGSFSELSNANAVYTATFGGVIATVKAASTAGAIYVTTRDSGLTAETVVDVVVACAADSTNFATLPEAYTYTYTDPSLVVAVPNVVGLTQAEAETDITGAGLVVGTVTEEYSETVAEGLVISQDPAAATMVSLGTAVDLVVSLGVQPPSAITVTGISPASAWIFGGIEVTISGTGFDANTTALLGATALEVTFVDETTLTATVPALAADAITEASLAVDLEVQRGTEPVETVTDGFTYVKYQKNASGETTTAFELADSNDIVLDGDLPDGVAKLTRQDADKEGDEPVYVLVRTSSAYNAGAPSFGLAAIAAGEAVYNVDTDVSTWNFDIHAYATDLSAEADMPASVLDFPIEGVALNAVDIDGSVSVYRLASTLSYTSPAGAPLFDAGTGTGEYESVILPGDRTVAGDAVVSIQARIANNGTFSLRTGAYAPTPDAADIELQDADGNANDSGLPAEVVYVVNTAGTGGLGYIDSVTFTATTGEKQTVAVLFDVGDSENEFNFTVPDVVVGLYDVAINLPSGDTIVKQFTVTEPFVVPPIFWIAALLAALGIMAGGDSGGGGGGPCFIATAAYGTPMADQIDTLRAVRDTYMLDNAAGAALVDVYYRVSPAIADVVAKSPVLATLMRILLTPVIFMSRLALAMPAMTMLTLMMASAIVVMRRRRKA